MADPQQGLEKVEGALVKETEEEAGLATEEEEEMEDCVSDAPKATDGPQEAMAPEVKRRFMALRNNQVEVNKAQAQFYSELHALEVKFMPTFVPLFKKRADIISGKYEPTDEECTFPQGAGTPMSADTPDAAEVTEKLEGMALNKDKEVKGIPSFWATLFQVTPYLYELIEDNDIPVLSHLIDIQVEMIESPMGFKLNFVFSPNEFFSNSVLTKTYEIKCEVNPDEPHIFKGPVIQKAIGCTIDWVKGKNVTVQTIQKKQRHKQRESIRTITKTVDVPSFFNFFNSLQIPDSSTDETYEEVKMKLDNDFEVGLYIRERLIPRAVLYYTGEASDDDDYDLDEEEEEEEEEETEDEDVQVPRRGSHNKH